MVTPQTQNISFVSGLLSKIRNLTIPENICGNLLTSRNCFPIYCMFQPWHALRSCVLSIFCLPSRLLSKKKEHVTGDYALSVVMGTNKSCKVLWCIYLWLQDPLLGFNKLASQKFAHLSSSCLPYGSKLHLANGIISSCPSDFHVQSYITMFMGGVCWSAKGGSAEKCLFCIPVFFSFS